MSERIKRIFKNLKGVRPAFIAYITAGDPDYNTSLGIVDALIESGVDVLELGVPFSDPLADGEVNQLSAQRALSAGITPTKVLALVADIRKKHKEIPIVLYTYLNPIAYTFGFRKFCKRAVKVGVDSLLLLDLTPEEGKEYKKIMSEEGLSLVALSAPTTLEERLELISDFATAFIYYVCREGVTGERNSFAENVDKKIAMIRKHTDLPVVLGFGISSPEHVKEAVETGVDGIVIGSAIVGRIAALAEGKTNIKEISSFCKQCSVAMQQSSAGILPADSVAKQQSSAGILPADSVAKQQSSAGILPADSVAKQQSKKNERATDTHAASDFCDIIQGDYENFLPFNPYDQVDVSQRYLPHWEQTGKTYFVTFRLADSLPRKKLDRWAAERKKWLNNHNPPLSEEELVEYNERFPKRLNQWLDRGSGSCILRDDKISEIVVRALKHFNGERYELGEWVVMPNHVHMLITPINAHKIKDIMHSLKSYTSLMINKHLAKSGTIWQSESYDHIVRNLKQKHKLEQYIIDNPREAKLKKGFKCSKG